MQQRNTKPDLLPGQLQQLSGIVLKDRTLASEIKKSNQNDSLLGNIKSFINRNASIGKEANAIAKSINEGFEAAKQDYDLGRINMVRYREVLTGFKDLFETDLKKSELPKALNTEKILSEIKKHI